MFVQAMSLVLLVALVPMCDALRFAHSYGDHMVLQAGPKQQAVVWGYCDKGTTEVTVGVDEHSVQASVVGTTWKAVLPPMPSSDKAYTVSAVDNFHKTVAINDVLFGDVWVCSGQVMRRTSQHHNSLTGQSNMAFLLENAFNGSAMVQEANDFPLLRLFTSKKVEATC